MNSNSRTWWALAVGVGLSSGVGLGQAGRDGEPESLLRQERKQAQIGQATSETAGLLAEVLDEFERNGLGGADVQSLGGMQQVLAGVSEEVMPGIVTDLVAARGEGLEADRRARALTAYAGQKSASYQLRQVVLEYDKQIALHRLSERVQELGDRQSANLHEVVALVLAQRKPSAVRRQADFSIARQLQVTEQRSLHDEVALVLAGLERLRASFEGSLEQRPAEALAFAAQEGLAVAMTQARDELEGDRFLSATSHQKAARDALWRLAAMLQPERDPLDRLLDGLATLDELIEREQEILAGSRRLGEGGQEGAEDLVRNDEKVVRLEQQLAQLERRLQNAEAGEQVRLSETMEFVQQRLGKELAAARERYGVAGPELNAEQQAERLQRIQAELADRTDFLREELADLAEAAAGHLGESIPPMQAARSALGRDLPPRQVAEAAVPAEEDALARLEEARGALLEAIEEERFVEEVPADKLEHLHEMLEVVRRIREDEEALKAKSGEAEQAGRSEDLRENHGPAQEDLGRETAEVGREAQGVSPEAARALEEAAQQMEVSAESLTAGRNAPLAQQAAIDSLQQAEEILGSQIAELEQAEEDLERLQELLEELDGVIAEQQEVQRDTIDEVAEPEAVRSQELAAKQGVLAEQASQLRQQAEAPAPEAAEHLGQAREHMEAARSDLAQTDPLEAQPEQGEALGDLQAARDALQARIAELQELLGQQGGGEQANLEEARAAIEEAQRQTAEAMAQLDQPAGALEQLQERQQALAERLGESAQEAENPSQATAAQAQPAAAEASRHLEEGNLSAAIESMQRAEDSLQGDPGVQAEAAEQAAVKNMAKALAEGARPASSPLQQANREIAPLAAGARGALPMGAQGALQQAQASLANAAAQANAGRPGPSQQEAAAAQEALAHASAALALAEAGLSALPEQGPGQGQAQGEGKGQGQGQGEGQGKGEGEGQGEGQGKGQGQGQGQGEEGQGNGNEGNWNGPGGADGLRRSREGGSRHIGLPDRERGALRQSQGDSYSPEFGTMIEQYLKNLSDGAGER